MIALQGKKISPGIAIGPVQQHRLGDFSIPQYKIDKDQIAEEIGKLKVAIIHCKKEIKKARSQIQNQLDDNHAKIIDSHIQVLDENRIIERTKKLVTNKKYNIIKAFNKIISGLEEKLLNSKSRYHQQRYHDLHQIKKHIIHYLIKQNGHSTESIKEPSILAGDYLLPSDFFNLNPKYIRGIITESGDMDSHLAIIANALKLPYISGIKHLDQLYNNSEIIIDANQGRVILDPDKKTKSLYLKKLKRKFEASQKFKAVKHTLDGTPFNIDINLEFISELEHLSPESYNGIGLFRTEFIALRKNSFPTESEQIKIYNQILDRVGDKPIIFRTFDFGRDKFIGLLENNFTATRNSARNIGGIKLCLENPEILRTQFKALLKVSKRRPFKIMFPMVSEPEEVHQAKRILAEIRQELEGENIKYHDLKLGAMIETVEILEKLDSLAKEVSFFSIGTNDLAYQLLRRNKRNSDLMTHHYHPELFKKIKDIVYKSKKNNISISLCGEMGSDPYALIGLVAMGIRAISVNTQSLEQISREVKKLDLREIGALDRQIHNCEDSATVSSILMEYFNQYVNGKNGK
jgi:phosphotransferase system enzyme I (PtsI)